MHGAKPLVRAISWLGGQPGTVMPSTVQCPAPVMMSLVTSPTLSTTGMLAHLLPPPSSLIFPSAAMTRRPRKYGVESTTRGRPLLSRAIVGLLDQDST